ncbi:hypothetical protein PWR63_32460 [Paraburkholderia sp. A2WS-5]
MLHIGKMAAGYRYWLGRHQPAENCIVFFDMGVPAFRAAAGRMKHPEHD